MASDHPQRETFVFYARQAFKLALSLVLFYAFALWTNWDVPRYGGLAIVIVSLGTSGASLKQGLMRIAGTTAGVLIGIVVLALFNDDRWATMLALSANIVLMCYCMQTSRYRYAWYAAGFIPLIVWADNYPHFDDAFYFSTFRWLETVVGVAIYTFVDLIFWPRRASDQLHAAGKGLVSSIRDLLRAYRRDETSAEGESTISRLRATAARQLSLTLASLQDALFDTPDVLAKKRLWESWRGDVEHLVDALEMWRESAVDSGVPVHSMPPDHVTVLEVVDARLARIEDLWRAWFAGDAIVEAGDDQLLTTCPVTVAATPVSPGAEFQHAARLSTARQLKLLDETSRQMLVTMRHLRGDATLPSGRTGSETLEPLPAITWDWERFILALFPAVTFVAAWLVWDFWNPPGGAKVAMLAGLVAIMVLRTPMNPTSVWVGMILSTAFVVAPVCWLIMPSLSTGVELLTLIFLLSFVFGCLGAKSPALKSGALIQFFASAGISNQQSYSFDGPVNGSLMVLIGGGVLTVIYNLWFPIRPEQSLLRSLRQTLRYFAEYSDRFDWNSRPVNDRRGRRHDRLMRAKIQSALAGLRRAVDGVDYEPYINNSRDDWRGLVNNLYRLAFRLQSFALAYQKTVSNGMMNRAPLAEKSARTMATISEILSNWSILDRPDNYPSNRGVLTRLRDELTREMSTLPMNVDEQSPDRETLIDTYAVIGSMRTIVRAIDAIHVSLGQIDCEQMSTPRF